MGSNQNQEKPMTEPLASLSSPESRFDYPLKEYELSLAGRDWKILHAGLMLTPADDNKYISQFSNILPYGLALWLASIVLAHDLASQAENLAGKSLLELGAGTGLPGLVAASLGARVSQTELQGLVAALCQLNGQRNGIEGIEYRVEDWTLWTDTRQYDYIIGADILYIDTLHDFLVKIFETNLAPGGHVLLADPGRFESMETFERLDRQGWQVDARSWEMSKGEDEREEREIYIFDLSRRI
jgi:predicted nicotinamide N-methyase